MIPTIMRLAAAISLDHDVNFMIAAIKGGGGG
jgi:hypothetical protein